MSNICTFPQALTLERNYKIFGKTPMCGSLTQKVDTKTKKSENKCFHPMICKN